MERHLRYIQAHSSDTREFNWKMFKRIKGYLIAQSYG